MSDTDVVCLEITSWMGLSIGASHWYGNLCGYIEPGKYERVELERTLTESQAATMNIERRKQFPGERDGFVWRRGMTTGSFETQDEVRSVAKQCWRNHFPAAVRLVEGNFAAVSKKPVLDSVSRQGQNRRRRKNAPLDTAITP